MYIPKTNHLQVNSLELVQEIHQVLMDNFAELKAVPGLCEGTEIRLVEGKIFTF